MAKVQDHEFPEQLFYDLDNQVWYDARPDGTVRAGFTPLAMTLAGDVLVFTPKRIGRDFERGRYFATIECGKWIGSARAAFDGVVLAHNETLMRQPGLLNTDAFGAGWMIDMRPAASGWKSGLVTAADIAPAFEAWFASGRYKDRAD